MGSRSNSESKQSYLAPGQSAGISRDRERESKLRKAVDDPLTTPQVDAPAARKPKAESATEAAPAPRERARRPSSRTRPPAAPPKSEAKDGFQALGQVLAASAQRKLDAGEKTKSLRELPKETKKTFRSIGEKTKGIASKLRRRGADTDSMVDEMAG